MRTSPTGHANTAKTLSDIATDIATVVAGDAKTHAQIALSAQMRTQELDGLLAQNNLSISQANTILSGLTNPNTYLKSVVVAAPYNTVAPTAPTGTKTQGQTLTAVTGTWIGDATITYTYQWIRHTSATSQTDGVNIAGATSATYVLAAGDVGKYVSVKITATNSAGVTGPVESVRTTVIS